MKPQRIDRDATRGHQLRSNAGWQPGSAERMQNTVVGDTGVNVAARLCGMAEPGGVLLTGAMLASGHPGSASHYADSVRRNCAGIGKRRGLRDERGCGGARRERRPADRPHTVDGESMNVRLCRYCRCSALAVAPCWSGESVPEVPRIEAPVTASEAMTMANDLATRGRWSAAQQVLDAAFRQFPGTVGWARKGVDGCPAPAR